MQLVAGTENTAKVPYITEAKHSPSKSPQSMSPEFTNGAEVLQITLEKSSGLHDKRLSGGTALRIDFPGSGTQPAKRLRLLAPASYDHFLLVLGTPSPLDI